MSYTCIDRGSEKCPCVLMEAGQCYTCGMIQRGKCDCLADWQGVCPYTEYVQNGKKPKAQPRLKELRVINTEIYSPTLTVITLECEPRLQLGFKNLGAYVMFKWKDWFVPISVLKADDEGVKFAINATGPKTIGLLEEIKLGDKVRFRGPFAGGLINSGGFDAKCLSIVVAKGIAVMPIIAQLELIGANLYRFYLDSSKLPQQFVDDYLKEIEIENVNLNEDFDEVIEMVEEDYQTCAIEVKQDANLFVAASPYYGSRVRDYLKERDVINIKKIIMPNHSNICCGLGICGSCSSTDENGVTHRMCKCLD